MTGSGRNRSIKRHGDEVYRLTERDGRWLWCDKYGHEGGDSIDLVRELEQCSFRDAVYRLAGGGSVRRVVQPAQAPIVHFPVMPPSTDRCAEAGRQYLAGRGIRPAAIALAEQQQALAYCGGSVLFVGFDPEMRPRSITRRAIMPNAPRPKRDIANTDKRYPMLLQADPTHVWVVEGGADALALWSWADALERPPEKWPTALVTGGVGTRSWANTPHVVVLLKAAEQITYAAERETIDDKQRPVDNSRERQIEAIQRHTSAKIELWVPTKGKDLAAHVKEAFQAHQQHEAARALQEQAQRQQQRQQQRHGPWHGGLT